MATGSVSATKFRAAAFGGCEAPAGDGRGSVAQIGVIATAGRAEEVAGYSLLTATGTSDIVYCAPSLTGPAEPPPCRTAGLKLAGCAGALCALSNHENKRNRGGVPPLFSPGSGCPPRSVRARAPCPLREQLLCGTGAFGVPVGAGEPRGGAGAGARGGPPGPVLRSSNEWGRARVRRAAAGVNKVT